MAIVGTQSLLHDKSCQHNLVRLQRLFGVKSNHISRRYPRRVASRAVRAMAAKKVLVPIANGSEEMEAVIIIDTLRRAGADVIVASVGPDLQVEMSRKVKLVADVLMSEATGDYDLIALPGGMPGAEHLRDSSDLDSVLQKHAAAGKLLTAICAAPAVVYESKGLLKGKKATCHPAFTDKLSDQSAVDQRVVVDGSIITSRGPGTALEFALQLVKELYGKEKADEVAGPMVPPSYQLQ